MNRHIPRRLGAMIGTAAVASSLAVVVGPAAVLATHIPGAAPASPGLASYTIYGEHGVFIGVGSTIPGLVGAKDGSLAPNGAAPGNGNSIGLNGTAVIQGDARSGENTNLANSAHITGTLTRMFSSTLHLGGGASVGTDNEYDTVDFPVLPGGTPLTCTSGGPPLGTGANGEVVSVGPGAYGFLHVGGGSSAINLTAAGDYFFDAVQTGNGTKWNVVAGVHVFVCADMNLGAGNDVLPTSLLASQVSWEVQSLDKHNAFKCGGGCDWIGNVFAPNGGIHFGSGSGPTTEVGTFHAQFVDIEHGVTLTTPPPPAPPEKSGHKFHDLNGNGVWDANEPGLNGWKITLYDASMVKITDALTIDDSFSKPGFYSFVLDAGTTYYVCETLQDGWVQTYPNASTPDPSDPDTGDVVISTCPGDAKYGYRVNLAEGENQTINDFGNFKKAHKQGMKFYDADNSGSFTAGDTAITSWPIKLYDSTNTLVASTMTDGNGKYSFEFVTGGTYKVCEGVVGALVQTYPHAFPVPNNPPDQVTNTCPAPNVWGYLITITSGAELTGNDFGNSEVACNKPTMTDTLKALYGAPDKIVHGWLNESVQYAVDNVTDINGDGNLVVEVIANADGSLGGTLNQKVEIKKDYGTKRFALFGCSVTLTGGGYGAALKIASTAKSANYNINGRDTSIYVMDVHGDNSAIGVWADGDNRYLRNEQAFGNTGIGIKVTGNNNTVHNGAAGDKGKGNTGDGVYVAGNGNLLTDTNAMANGSNGFTVIGNTNTLRNLDSGDRGKGNAVDGIHVEGFGNYLEANDAVANGTAGCTTCDGFDVSGATTSASANKVKNNNSNKGASGSDQENTGAEYRLSGYINNNGGGNKADTIEVPKTTAPTKGIAFPAKNATLNEAANTVIE